MPFPLSSKAVLTYGAILLLSLVSHITLPNSNILPIIITLLPGPTLNDSIKVLCTSSNFGGDIKDLEQFVRGPWLTAAAPAFLDRGTCRVVGGMRVWFDVGWRRGFPGARYSQVSTDLYWKDVRIWLIVYEIWLIVYDGVEMSASCQDVVKERS